MQYRPLGQTGMNVSAIGLGCVQIGHQLLEPGVRLVQRALDLGINYFDAARGYGDAELILGEALKGQRERIYVSTKTGAKTREQAWQGVQESLARLQTTYLDNCHIHGLRSGEDTEVRLGPGGALEALVQARDQGLVRHIGVSAHTSADLLQALERFPFEVILVPMNLVEPEPLEELVPLCQRRGVGITIMKPVATGLLPATLALKWLLNQPIASAVPGTTTLDELEENAAVGWLADTGLSPAEEAEVQELRQYWAHRRCRICLACEPCSQGMIIGFELGSDETYNHYRTMGREAFASFPWTRTMMERDLSRRETLLGKITHCETCRACEPRCPHGLPTVAMMQALVPAFHDMIAIYRHRLQSRPDRSRSQTD